MRCALILFLALHCLLDDAVAEERRGGVAEEQDLDEGVRVRVATSRAGTITGRIKKLTADTLLIELDDDSRSVSLPFAELTKIEISGGRRSRAQGAWSKAKWGAVIGAVPGAISLGFGHEQIGENGSSVGKAAALGAWSGGLFGGLIGAAIGAINPGEKWEIVTPSFRIGTARQGDPGFSFTVTIGF